MYVGTVFAENTKRLSSGLMREESESLSWHRGILGLMLRLIRIPVCTVLLLAEVQCTILAFI